MMTRGRQVFPGRADQVSQARAFVRDRCGTCPAADEAVLLASELCTNAVLHSASGAPGGSFEVTIDRGPRSLRVEVRDEGPRPVGETGELDVLAENGRGLQIVGLLANHWGQICGPGSRMAYFALDWAQSASGPGLAPAAAPPMDWPSPATACRPEPRRPGAGSVYRPASQLTASAQRWYVTLDGQRVRELRIGRGLSQERVCQQAGISTATIRRLEAERWPTCRGRTAALIAGPLGTDLVSLLAPSPARAS
jgi:anti-sigma regulatory factor (Ser/Thr protein kinase)